MLQPEDEVVEVFTGGTLEEAMAYAVASLGPDLSVRRARKVRKGVQGLVGKDRYEVIAIPAPTPSSDDAVGSAFDALLTQAEQAETPQGPTGRRTTRPARAATVEPVVIHPEIIERPRVPAPAAVASPTPEPVAEPARPPAPAARPVPKARQAAVRKPKAAALTRTPPARKKSAAPSGWSRAALVELGLPAAVLDALPAQDPVDDLAWVVALAVSLSAVLPAPGALGADNPLVVNGYGMAGVLGLLDAAARGLTPGTITVGDRTVCATATELALAVRTAVVG